MAVLAQDAILDFARRILSEGYYREFVRLLHLREHTDPVIRGDADVKLMPFIELLHKRLDGLS